MNLRLAEVVSVQVDNTSTITLDGQTIAGVAAVSGTVLTAGQGAWILQAGPGQVLIVGGAGSGSDTAWAAYTPTLTNVTLGNGALDFRWRRVGPTTAHVRGTLTFGSTTEVSGLIGFGYPSSLASDITPRSIGHAWLLDNTGPDFLGTCQAGSSIWVYYTGILSTGATSPFTWTTSDTVSIDIIYEIS